MTRRLPIAALTVMTALLFAACAVQSPERLAGDAMRNQYMRMGSLQIEQFELAAFSYREGAVAQNGSSAKGGCGCN